MNKDKKSLLIPFTFFIIIFFHNKEAGALESKWQTFAFAQALAAVHGGVAAADADIPGVIELSVPVYLGLQLGWPEKRMWPFYIGYLALGIYNVSVNEDKTPDGEIFLTNYVGVNLIFLSSMLLQDDEDNVQKGQERNALNTFLYFENGSAVLTVSYNF